MGNASAKAAAPSTLRFDDAMVLLGSTGAARYQGVYKRLRGRAPTERQGLSAHTVMRFIIGAAMPGIPSTVLAGRIFLAMCPGAPLDAELHARSLTEDDWLVACAVILEGDPATRAAFLFRVYDTEGNGRLTHAEAVRYMHIIFEDRPRANANTVYARAVDDIMMAAWSIADAAGATPVAAGGAAPPAASSSKRRRLVTGESRADVELTAAEWAGWAIAQCGSISGTSRRPAATAAWARNPLTGWLDHLALGLEPDGVREAALVRWVGKEQADKLLGAPPRRKDGNMEGAAADSPAEATPLSSSETAALSALFAAARSRAPSGLFDAQALAALLHPLLPASTRLADVLFASADVDRHGSLSAPAFISWAARLLTAPPEEHVDMLTGVHARGGVALTSAGLVAMLEGAGLAQRVAAGSRPEGGCVNTATGSVDAQLLARASAEARREAPKIAILALVDMGLLPAGSPSLGPSPPTIPLAVFAPWAARHTPIAMPMSLARTALAMAGVRPQSGGEEARLIASSWRSLWSKSAGVGECWYILPSSWWRVWLAWTGFCAAVKAARAEWAAEGEGAGAGTAQESGEGEGEGDGEGDGQGNGDGARARPAGSLSPPGPLPTSTLLLDSLTLRPGLRRGYGGDYVLVAPRVWAALSAWYGVTGPPIERRTVRAGGAGEVGLEVYPAVLRFQRLAGQSGKGGKGLAPSPSPSIPPISPASSLLSDRSTDEAAVPPRAPVFQPLPPSPDAEALLFSRATRIAGIVEAAAAAVGVRPERVRLWRRVPDADKVLAAGGGGRSKGGATAPDWRLACVRVWPYIPLFTGHGSAPLEAPLWAAMATVPEPALAPRLTSSLPVCTLLVDVKGSGAEDGWSTDGEGGFAAAFGALSRAAGEGRLSGGWTGLPPTEELALAAWWAPQPAPPPPGTPLTALSPAVLAASPASALLGPSLPAPSAPGGPGPVPITTYALLPASSRTGLGIANLGNTCYLSATMQALLALPLLPHYFLSRSWEAELNTTALLGTGGRLATAFATTIVEAWEMTGSELRPPVLAPRRLKACLARAEPRFEGSEQHDAAEALEVLFDKLGEDLNRVLGSKPWVEVGDSAGRSDTACAEEWWVGQVLSRDRSVLKQLFGGQFRSTLTCTSCGHTSVRFEPFSMLSLPLPEQPTRAFTVVVVTVGVDRARGGGPPTVVCVHAPASGSVGSLRAALLPLLEGGEPSRLLLGRVNGPEVVEEPLGRGVGGLFLGDDIPLALLRDGLGAALVAWAVYGRAGSEQALDVVGSPVWIAPKGEPGQAVAAIITSVLGEGTEITCTTLGVGGAPGTVVVVPPAAVATRTPPLQPPLLLHHTTLALVGSGTTPVGVELGAPEASAPPCVGPGSLGAPFYGHSVLLPPAVGDTTSTTWLATPLARVVWGAPLLLLPPPEVATPLSVYWRVWGECARFLRRRPPYASYEAAVEGESTAPKDRGAIAGRWGFVLTRSRGPRQAGEPGAGTCSECPWLSRCTGCVVPPHPSTLLSLPSASASAVLAPAVGGSAWFERGVIGEGLSFHPTPPAPSSASTAPSHLAIEWESGLLEASCDRVEAGRVMWHPSVAAAVEAAERPVSLDACLDLFSREEALDEEAFCPACSKVGACAPPPTPTLASFLGGGTAEAGAGAQDSGPTQRRFRKRIEPYRLPPILILQLKRFQHTAYVRRKLQTAVAFPVDEPLCMRPHLARSGPPRSSRVDLRMWKTLGGRLAPGEEMRTEEEEGKGEEAGAPPSPLSDGAARTRRLSTSAGPAEARASSSMGIPLFVSRSECCFELWAVVQHHGIMGGGHYTAMVRAAAEGEDGVVGWAWRLANDKVVTPVGRDGGPRLSVCSPAAYLLFYVRLDIAAGWRAALAAAAAGSPTAGPGAGRLTRAAVEGGVAAAGWASPPAAAYPPPCDCLGCARGESSLGGCARPTLTIEDVWPVPLSPSPCPSLPRLLEEVRAAGNLNTATGTLTTVLAAVPGVSHERAAQVAQAAASSVPGVCSLQ
jgi:ubiquitin C-terminal hydrolase